GTGRGELVAVSPATGAVLADVPAVQRAMSTTPGLYQATGTPSRLVGIRTPGGARWSKRVTSVFGSGYDPDNGWVFDRFGAVEVGSVGKAPVGRTIQLADTRIVGISEASGRRLWAEPGEFQCDGAIGLGGSYLCLM